MDKDTMILDTALLFSFGAALAYELSSLARQSYWLWHSLPGA